MAVIRDLLLGIGVVCLIPLAILLVGAPVALFVRLLLEAARLVTCEERGRTTLVALRTDGVVAAAGWLGGLWPEALARFAAEAEATWSEP